MTEFQILIFNKMIVKYKKVIICEMDCQKIIYVVKKHTQFMLIYIYYKKKQIRKSIM